MFLRQEFQVVKVNWRNIKAANSKHSRKLVGSCTTTAESLDSGIMIMSFPCHHIQFFFPPDPRLNSFNKIFCEPFPTFILSKLCPFRVLQVIVCFCFFF